MDEGQLPRRRWRARRRLTACPAFRGRKVEGARSPHTSSPRPGHISQSADAVAESVTGHADFRRLWVGLTISQVGSAIGGTALPIVAVNLVKASTVQVSLLAALTSLTAVAVALPTGAAVEFRHKRPLMVAADLIRVVVLCSIPLAYVFHRLTFTQLCVAAVISSVCQLLFLSASQANLVSLVSRRQLVDANGRLQASTWLSMSIGPAIGGLLISVFNAVGTVFIDGVSYLASATAVLRLRQPEPAPPLKSETASKRSELVAGLRFLLGRPDLRALLISWVLYAGCAGMTTPLTYVFYLRHLDYRPWQYGLIMGLPSLGGFAGSRLTRRAVARYGSLRSVRMASYLRVPGFFVITVAVRGGIGVAMCCAGFAAMLFFSSLSNSAMTSYRQLQTPVDLLSRVATFWSLATTVGQPVFIVIGGFVADALGLRPALMLAGLGMLASALLLPSRRSVRDRPIDAGTATT